MSYFLFIYLITDIPYSFSTVNETYKKKQFWKLGYI